MCWKGKVHCRPPDYVCSVSFQVRSFGGALLRVQSASLAEMEVSQGSCMLNRRTLWSCAYAPQEEFDVLWPEGDNLRLLGKDVCDR